MCLANKTTPIFFGENFDENYPKIAVPNYLIYDFGAKLSVFTMLVPNCPFSYLCAKLSVCLLGANCPFLLSWCQIVRCQNVWVPNCPVPNCPTTRVHLIILLKMTLEFL